MRNLKFIAITLFSLILTVKSYSQGNISIHVGSSLPVSDFASDDSEKEDAAGAAVGLNVGVKYIYPITQNGLGIFGGIDFNYNGLKKSVKDDFEEPFEEMGINDLDIKYNKYLNIPITAGLDYTYQPNDNFGVFANVGLAYNLLQVTDMEIKTNGATLTMETDLATSVGFKIGAGVLINEQISVAIDYWGLGEYDTKTTIKSDDGSDDIEGKLKVDLLTLTVGFRF